MIRFFTAALLAAILTVPAFAQEVTINHMRELQRQMDSLRESIADFDPAAATDERIAFLGNFRREYVAVESYISVAKKAIIEDYRSSPASERRLILENLGFVTVIEEDLVSLRRNEFRNLVREVLRASINRTDWGYGEITMDRSGPCYFVNVTNLQSSETAITETKLRKRVFMLLTSPSEHFEYTVHGEVQETTCLLSYTQDEADELLTRGVIGQVVDTPTATILVPAAELQLRGLDRPKDGLIRVPADVTIEDMTVLEWDAETETYSVR